MKNSFLFSAGSTLFANILIMLLALISGSLVARMLGPIGKGELSVIQIIGSLIATLLASGIPASVVYFVASDKNNSSSYYFIGILISLLTSIPLIGIAYFVTPLFLPNYNSNIILAAQIYLIFIPLTIITSFSLAYFQGLNKISTWNYLRLFAGAAWVLPVVAMYLSGLRDAILFSQIYLAFTFLSAILFFYVSFKSITPPLRIEKKLTKPLLSKGIPNTITTILQQNNIRLDQLVIAYFLAPFELGIYVVAQAWSTASLPLMNVFSLNVVPYIASLDMDENKNYAASRIIRTSIFFSIVITLLLLIITEPMIKILFGYNFINAIYIAYILISFSLFSDVKVVLSEVLRSYGKSKFIMYAEFTGTFFYSIFLVISAKTWGLKGIAFSSVAANFVTFVILLLETHRISNLKYRDIFLLKSDDIFYLKNRFTIIFSEIYYRYVKNKFL